MEFAEVVRRRRMVRDFLPDPVDPELVDQLVEMARRAPSAGNSQGTAFVVLEGDDVARYWDTTLPAPRRPTFPWPGLLRAPVLVLPCAHAEAYVARYAEGDKARTGLGVGHDAWVHVGAPSSGVVAEVADDELWCAKGAVGVCP